MNDDKTIYFEDPSGRQVRARRASNRTKVFIIGCLLIACALIIAAYAEIHSASPLGLGTNFYMGVAIMMTLILMSMKVIHTIRP